MAEGGRGGSTGLAFMVGGLVVVVVVIAWVLFSGGGAVEPPARDVNIDVNLPEAPAAPGGEQGEPRP